MVGIVRFPFTKVKMGGSAKEFLHGAPKKVALGLPARVCERRLRWGIWEPLKNFDWPVWCLGDRLLSNHHVMLREPFWCGHVAVEGGEGDSAIDGNER